MYQKKLKFIFKVNKRLLNIKLIDVLGYLFRIVHDFIKKKFKWLKVVTVYIS